MNVAYTLIRDLYTQCGPLCLVVRFALVSPLSIYWPILEIHYIGAKVQTLAHQNSWFTKLGPIVSSMTSIHNNMNSCRE